MAVLTFNALAQDSALIQNGSFDTDESWTLTTLENATITSEVSSGSYCATVENGGRDIWSVQLAQTGFEIEEGETYTLTLDVSSTAEKKVLVKLGQDALLLETLFTASYLAGGPQTISETFTVDRPGIAAAKLAFFMGTSNQDAAFPATVCLDNVSLVRGSGATGVNLIENADFADASTASWSLGADNNGATGSVVEGEYCTVISNAGENPWSVALRQAPLNLLMNKQYQLSFDAYADDEMTLGVKLGQSVEPYSEYFFQNQTLSGQKTNYTLNADISSSDANGQLELFMGGTNTPPVPTTVCFDNFVLSEVSAHGEERVIPYIMIDQFGYRPNDEKVAVLVDPQEGFNADDSFEPSGTVEVRRADDDSVVFSGETIVWNSGEMQESSGDKGWWVDFSSVTEPGSYYLADPENDMRSYSFDIAEDVYKNVLVAAMRMFYYNRANVAKEEPYADPRWADGVNYVGNGQDTEARFVEDKENAELALDLSGGWFDAGDVNKYVTFAESPVHLLLTAFEENSQAFTDDFNIPESGNEKWTPKTRQES